MNYENIFKKSEERLEHERQEKLKEYGLDDESIKEFKSKIKKVHDNKRNWLSEMLMQKISSSYTYSEVENLILSGADVNYSYVTSENLSILSYCTRYKKLSNFKLLLRADYKFSEKDIIECVQCNREINLEILILLGANLNIKTHKGLTLIEVAKSNKKCLEILEKYLNIQSFKKSENEIEMTLSSALKEAEEKMNKILKDTPFQKVKK